MMSAIKRLCTLAVSRYACYLLLVLCLVMAAGRTQAEDAADWVPAAVTAVGRIYHREIEDSRLPMVMITTGFDAPPAAVHAVVTDYDHFAEFIPNVLESRVLLSAGGQQWVFHHLRFPGPVADRAYVFRSSESEGSQQPGYRVEWQLSARRFPAGDATAGIRPRRLSGFWDLRPAVAGAGTEARYAVHSDPGGNLPAWLVARMTDRYVQQVIAAVRERLARQ